MSRFQEPPCPVHRNAGFERVAEIPDGCIGFIGSPEAFARYVGDVDVPVMLVRRIMPPEYPVQLKLAVAPEPDDDVECECIEPLDQGSFMMRGGVVVDIDEFMNVCLFDVEHNRHTLLCNWLVPSQN